MRTINNTRHFHVLITFLLLIFLTAQPALAANNDLTGNNTLAGNDNVAGGSGNTVGANTTIAGGCAGDGFVKGLSRVERLKLFKNSSNSRPALDQLSTFAVVPKDSAPAAGSHLHS